jgi:2-polyprenyl-3-methyl-5-hydroxy-6-metoxy-1,4-benzoquinol methylase
MLDRMHFCNNCGAPGHDMLYAAGVAQRHQIVRCTACGLMYAYPMGVNLEQYTHAGDEPMSEDSATVVRSRDRLPDYEPIGVELREFLPSAGRLLEVGCHAGVLLDRFRAQGWKVRGVEPDPRAAGFARTHFGLEVSASTLEEARFAPKSFDAVVMLHVIEHLDDPARTVSQIADVLRPRGIFAVETPVYDTLIYRLLGRRERSLSCDGHVYFYTARTLAALLERCGFEIVRQRRVGRTMSLGRLLWNLGVMSKSKALARLIERTSAALDLARRGRLYFNAGDMLRVYARKRA